MNGRRPRYDGRRGESHGKRTVVGTFSAFPGNSTWAQKEVRASSESLKPFVMTPELKYPLWQEPLMAALLEFDSKQQRGKVEKAEEAIVRRIQEIASAKGGESELRLLHDGLSLIRQLKGRLAQPSTTNW